MDYKDTLNLPKTKFPMKANLSQKEPQMLKKWDKMGIYKELLQKGKDRPKFILHDGPPYANGHLHLGHTVNKVLKDIIIKFQTMTGKSAPFVPGWDCHGLPIEHNVEKKLGSKRHTMDKLAIRKKCREYAERFVDIQRKEFERLGVLGDWGNPYLTMNFDYEATIAKEFCQIYLDGYVVRSTKPVHWCPTCVTALAEAEVEYAPHTSPSITVRFPCTDEFKAWLKERVNDFNENDKCYVLIWTTTPWTLPANRAVAVHPDFDYVVVKVPGQKASAAMSFEEDGRDEIWVVAEGRLQAILLALGLEQTDVEILHEMKGSDLEGLKVLHPFIDRQGPVIVADYVTLDSGTGIVHIAPGHGTEDYESSRRYDLEVFSPVDDRGLFTKDVEAFEGQHIFKANPEIVELLKRKGMLVHTEELSHSYPHCWRCKRPVIFRATAQWFISMEKNELRSRALKSIDQVTWIPAWGRERIYGMVEARPDWCISRQRAWGVPITVFTCQSCGKSVLTEESANKIVEIFEKEGADAWFDKSVEDFLPEGFSCPECGSSDFKKEEDILDVWFDSGVSHAAVLERRPELSWPADMYLEGSDQHRGWFQSSLLTSVATRGSAPYRSVLTHGFVVDGKGKKMSKSVGNVIPPEKLIKRFGAEILRLWVSAEDYRDDIKISDEILQRLTEAYRKIRNTIRYLLSNLNDFDPEKNSVPLNELESLDRWALDRVSKAMERVRKGYEEYKFHVVFHQIHQLCTVDLSALYLDIVKDRLYCELTDGRPRRSCQTALYHIARSLIINMAPVLSFTADEAWAHLIGNEETSVFFEEFPRLQDALLSEEEETFWAKVIDLRNEITKALELARREKRIGLALDAKVLVKLPEDIGLEKNQDLAQCLKMVTIVSQLELVDSFDDDQVSQGNIWQSEEFPGLSCLVLPAEGQKCARCWTWSTYVGKDTEFPDVCERCASVLRQMGFKATTE